LWKGVCEGEGDNHPATPTSDKELTIWEIKNSKAYAFIAALGNEEVSHHIYPFSNSFEAINKLKELCVSHFELEVVQLMIKFIMI